jgi:hypothetical protein
MLDPQCAKSDGESRERIRLDFNEWDPAHSSIFGCAIPFLEPLVFFAKMASALFSFFFTITLLVRPAPCDGQDQITLQWTLLLIPMSSLVCVTVYSMGWLNFGKKMCYYKLLKRGVLLDYDNTPAYYSPVIWLLMLTAMGSVFPLMDGAEFGSVVPLFTLLAGIVSSYWALIETEKSLIPLNMFFEGTGAAEHQKGKAFIEHLTIVKEEALLRCVEPMLGKKVVFNDVTAALKADPEMSSAPKFSGSFGEFKARRMYLEILKFSNGFRLPFEPFPMAFVTLGMGSVTWFYGLNQLYLG